MEPHVFASDFSNYIICAAGEEISIKIGFSIVNSLKDRITRTRWLYLVVATQTLLLYYDTDFISWVWRLCKKSEGFPNQLHSAICPQWAFGVCSSVDIFPV
jgi:hypothetical protein